MANRIGERLCDMAAFRSEGYPSFPVLQVRSTEHEPTIDEQNKPVDAAFITEADTTLQALQRTFGAQEII